jgi:hypothetical protein
MTDRDRRSLLRAAVAGSVAAVPAAGIGGLLAAPDARAATVTGPYAWVGPAGSGAPYEVDTAAGAQVAINAALQAVGQGEVLVAGGTYPVKGPVVIGDHQSLRGTGPLSTLLKAVSGYTGGAMVQTPSGTFTGSRMVLADLGLEAAHLATNGVNLQIGAAPSSYGPDPNPWLSRLFVSNTTGDGIVLGGAYSGGQREYKIAECRVEHAGGWCYNLGSSDGFVGMCSAQGGLSGGYNLAAGNVKVFGCKVYSSGDGATPGPGFRTAARVTMSGCEAQDTLGCGYEILGRGSVVSGCTADSTGVGAAGTDRYSAGFYVGASVVTVDGAAYQRPGGGATWLGATGMRWSLMLASGVDYVLARLVSDPNRPAPYQGTVSGTAGAHSSVTVLG